MGTKDYNSWRFYNNFSLIHPLTAISNSLHAWPSCLSSQLKNIRFVRELLRGLSLSLSKYVHAIYVYETYKTCIIKDIIFANHSANILRSMRWPCSYNTSYYDYTVPAHTCVYLPI